MQTMQRQFGKLLTRSPDNAQVAMLINDFDEADKMLDTLIDAAKAWEQAWNDILQRQTAMLVAFEIIYTPIVTSDGSASERFSNTPKHKVERVSALKAAYSELKDDMLEEVQFVQTRIIIPAKEARSAIQPFKKAIKKREDRKLDYERYKSRVEGVEKKLKRSERDNAALAKHRADLETATAEYNTADDFLKANLPGLTNATYSILPHLLNNQIMIQNSLLAHLYTALHNFSQDFGYPSPAPEFANIIAEFEADFTPVRTDLEANIKMISTGKAVRQPMELSGESRSLTGLNIRNGISNRRAKSSTAVPVATRTTRPPPTPSPEPELAEPPPSAQPPPIDFSTRPKIQSMNSWAGTKSESMLSSNSTPPQEQAQFFSPASHVSQFRPRQPSAGSSVSTLSAASAAVGKKKPPPPPPPKRNISFVTALYDFDGQGAGDLRFREGDRIRVVKKTESVDDWWEGELRGVQGSFPANYCR